MFKILQRPDPGPSRLIYLVADPGHPNYGGEVVARRWLETIALVEPQAEVWVDCPTPGPAAILLKSAHPNVHFTDTLFRLCADAPDENPFEVDAFVTAALDDPGRAPRWIPGIDLLHHVDVFHILGGGYINTVWPRHTGLIAAARWMSHRTRARVAGTGLGLVPATDGAADLWLKAAADFDVLTIRDEESLDLFDGGPQARLAPDDIFLRGLSSVYSRTAGAAPEFMICVQEDLLDGPFAPIAQTVASTLRTWGAADRSIGVVECIPRVDRRIYDELLPAFPQLQFFSLWEILNDGFPAAAHQRWISSRYHAHLLAAAAGASGVTLSVRGDYYDAKHDGVRRMGSQWTSVTAGDTAGEAGAPGTLPARSARHSEIVLGHAREIYQVRR